jgi:hypothetical protein
MQKQLHTTQNKRSGMLWGLLALLALLGSGTSANATHFRGGTLTWQQAGGRTIQFTLNTSWRRGYFITNFGASTNVGTTVNLGSPLTFGDGGSTGTIIATVTSSDAAADVVTTTYTVSRTYAANGNYNATFTGCCRLSNLLQNNNDQTYTLISTVNVGGPPFNNPPVSALPPFVNIPINSTNNLFTIPATDPDGDPVTFRLSTSAESGLVTPLPTGFTLNSNGTFSMNTTGRTNGQLFTVQIMMEDRTSAGVVKSKVPVDILIRMVPFSNPPIFVSPTPLAPSNSFSVLPGNAVSFTIAATDTDANQAVTLNPVSIPVGAAMSPGLPVVGPTNGTASSTFSWTPTAAQVGTNVINFVASDNVGVQAVTSVSITVQCALNATPTVSSATCAGMSNGAISLAPQNYSATTNLSYSWTGPNSFTSTSQNISGLTAGTYNVRIDDAASGCFKMLTVVVPNAITLRPLIFSNSPVCTDLTLSMDAGGGNTYTWTGPNGFSSNQSSPSIPNVTAANAGVYTLTARHTATGCTASVSTTVTVLPAPVVTITPNGPTSFCQGGSVTLTASGATSYEWNDPTTSTATSITTGTSGNYTVIGTDDNGCSASASTTAVVVYPLPVVTITPNGPTSFCQGGNVTLVAGGASSYVWSNTATGGSINVNASGSFTVTGTDANGCVGTSAATAVTINPSPSFTATATDATCNGDASGKIIVSATGGTPAYSYTNGGAYQTSNTFSGLSAGTYSVAVADANGCTAPAQSVTVGQPAALVVGQITGSSTFCTMNTIYTGYGPQSVPLSVSASGGNPGYTYLWTPGGATTASIVASPTTSTLYTVTVKDANQCTQTRTILVTVKDVRCGNKNDKVQVCHNGSIPICISPSAVPAHMSNHGDCLGDCSNTYARSTAQGQTQHMDLEEGAIIVFPNPAHGKITVELKEMGSPYRSYQITDINGRVLVSQQLAGDVHADLISVDIQNLIPGIYIIRAVTDHGTNLTKFTVE